MVHLRMEAYRINMESDPDSIFYHILICTYKDLDILEYECKTDTSNSNIYPIYKIEFSYFLYR
jgi:hypothetical protein